MRVACLVIAYSGAAVLAHTLPVYRRAGWDVFVHLDAKADIDVYRTAMAEAADQCRFIPNRTKVFWGGYSMMQAEFDLIHTARAASQYDRYVIAVRFTESGLAESRYYITHFDDSLLGRI